MPLPDHHYRDLYQLLLSIDTEEEARALLSDLLTPQELDSLAERWQIVQELAAGRPQREIAAKLKTSVAKVSRGSRILQYGAGGFKRFLEKH